MRAAVVVPLNPMYTGDDLKHYLDDCGARLIICQDDLYPQRVQLAAASRGGVPVITTSPLDLLATDAPPPRQLAHVGKREFDGVKDLMDLIAGAPDQDPEILLPGVSDLAYPVYTSGTTGPAKGAHIRHSNVVHNAKVYEAACRLDRSDVALGVAPLFHITGIVAHLAIAFHLGTSVILSARFDVVDAPRLIERYRATITPLGMQGPVDEASGALSVGLVIPGHEAWIVDLDRPDVEVPTGQEVELVLRGPGITDGYWKKPHETANAIKDGCFFTGDVAKFDEDGWCYIVDRKKDLINASGFKVWPREVEDVLYQHPAVKEAAVVGVPDEYRGETV